MQRGCSWCPCIDYGPDDCRASAVELPADAATLNAATPAADGRDLARLWRSSFGGLPSAAMLAKAGTVLAVVIFARGIPEGEHKVDWTGWPEVT